MPPFPESSRCLSPFQGNLFSLHCLDFQAEDQLTPRWRVGQPFGKAWWESLVGKPHGKASRESHRCFDPREGKRDTSAKARKESPRASPHSRRALTPLGRLQKYPKINVSTGEETSGLAPTPHKVLGPDMDWRGIPRDHREAPEQLARGLAFPEATRAGP